VASVSLPYRGRPVYGPSVNYADIFDFSGDKVRSPRLHVHAYPIETADTRRRAIATIQTRKGERARAIVTRQENYRRRRVWVSKGLRERAHAQTDTGTYVVCGAPAESILRRQRRHDTRRSFNASTERNGYYQFLSTRGDRSAHRKPSSVEDRRPLITWSRGRPQCRSPFANFRGGRFLKTFAKL